MSFLILIVKKFIQKTGKKSEKTASTVSGNQFYVYIVIPKHT